MIRYTTEHMGISNGGTVTAETFGAVAHEAGADRDHLRTLLAQGRTKGYGPAPCAPDEVSTEDHAAALVGYDGAAAVRITVADSEGSESRTVTL